uniref:hypothetical protein n=1 Tax=Candidatus Ventrimonas sp. TaxID=3048889 RepID=UPI003FF11196
YLNPPSKASGIAVAFFQTAYTDCRKLHLLFSITRKKLASELLRLRRVASATKFSAAAWRFSRSVFVS